VKLKKNNKRIKENQVEGGLKKTHVFNKKMAKKIN
jgi:hypothetical protein